MTTEYSQNKKPVALITGAAKRIGATLARAIANTGFHVVLHFRTSKQEAETLAKELNNTHPNSASLFEADLTKLSEIENLAAFITRKFQRCDLLVNNASSFYATPIGHTTEKEWDDLISSNVKAPFFLSQALSPLLKETNGSIINIADIHGIRPLANHTVYSVAKAANLMLTKSLAQELAPEVRVNSISPGAIIWPEQSNAEHNKAILNKIPLTYLGSPQNIADTLLFLINKNSYITGQNISVDGGRTLNQ